MSPGLFSKEDTNCVFSIPRQMLPAKFIRNNTQAIHFPSATLRAFLFYCEKMCEENRNTASCQKRKDDFHYGKFINGSIILSSLAKYPITLKA